MDWIFILIAVLIIIGNINKKKQKQAQEEARRRAMQQQAAGQGGQPQSYDMPYTPPSPSMEGRRADPRFPDYTPAPQADPRFPNYAPEQPASAQRQAAPRPAQQRHTPPQQPLAQQAQPRVRQTMGEGMGTTLPRAATTVRSHDTTLQEVMGRRHTLEASSLTGHAHTETGMSGSQEPCPPAAQIVKAPQLAAVKAGPAALMGDRNALAQAIIVSEILGKPKALRR
ncbi:MAG: hypothetical protein AAGU77_10550 [Bacillota bacterium]